MSLRTSHPCEALNTGGWKSWLPSQVLPNAGGSWHVFIRLRNLVPLHWGWQSSTGKERSPAVRCHPEPKRTWDFWNRLILLAKAVPRDVTLLLLSWGKVVLSSSAQMPIPVPPSPPDSPDPSTHQLRVKGSRNNFTWGCYWQERICICSLRIEDSTLLLWGISSSNFIFLSVCKCHEKMN